MIAVLFAHIGGLPVEETALSFGPVIAAGGGIATLKLREHLRRADRKRPWRRRYSSSERGRPGC
jgi:hypothetical protein